MVNVRASIKAVLLTATLGVPAGVGVLPGSALAQTLPADPSNSTSTGDTSQTSSPSPAEILRNPQASQDARDAAAFKLAGSHEIASRTILVDVLSQPDAGGQLAVARALGEISWPAPEFVEPLFQLLVSHEAQHERVEAAAAALAQYRTSADVLQRLVVVANSNQGDEIRLPVIGAIGTFDQKLAAQTLIDLQQRGQSTSIEQAAGDALIELTGLEEFGHDAQRWKQWWSQFVNRSESEFQAEVRKDRAEAFERVISRQHQLTTASDKLLTDAYHQAAASDRGDLLIRYLRSGSPEIRALGASIALQERNTPDGAPPAAMKEIRGMLDDPVAEVRMAVAESLYNDADATKAMIDRLGLESDDMVRAALVRSVAPRHDPAAVAAMTSIVQNDASLRVRIEAADGIRQAAADTVSKDPDLQRKTVSGLLAALKSTDAPGMQSLRAAIVAALAEIHEPKLSATFRLLLNSREPLEVQLNALRGVGNLQDPDMGDLISGYLQDPNPDLRRTAVTALSTPAQPIFIEKLLGTMSNDTDDSVRTAAWATLEAWIPSLGDHDLDNMADALKANNPARQLEVLRALRDRLLKDAQSAPDDQQRAKAARDAATEEQDIADASMQVGQYAGAAEQYRAALTYWNANGGTPEVIDKLSGGLVRALLKAQNWDQATDFASKAIAEYDNVPAQKVTQATVGQEFLLEADELSKSDDPDAYDRAKSFFAAVDRMNPPLKGSYPTELKTVHDQIEQKHAGQSTPAGSPNQ